MRVLVCGDRSWNDTETIRTYLSRLLPGTVIVHGAQGRERRRRDGTTYWVGADTQADMVARELFLETEAYPADRDRLGDAAGPIRNKEMLDSGVGLVLAFHDHLRFSKGTRGVVEEAGRRGIPFRVVGSRSTREPPEGA